MSDKLKNFIAENDASFDSFPKPGHFERFSQKQIETTLVKKSNRDTMPAFIKIAAIFVLVFGIGWLFFNLGKIEGAQEFAISTVQQPINASNELIEAEYFFTEQVKLKKEEVLANASNNNEETKQILLEVEKLELQYLDLKEELIINNNSEQVINAMIENFRMRLSVLEKLLKQLKKSNTIKQNHNENIQA